MYKKIYAIIKALRECSSNSRAALTHNTKTRILFIILLQPQIFVQGKLVGKQGCLGKSTNMVNQLAAEKCEKISHIEVPTELLHQGEKRQKTSTKGGNN